MNTIDPDVVKMMNEAVEIAEKDYRGLVIANDGEHFGAGANIFMVLMSANMGAFDQVDTMVASSRPRCSDLGFVVYLLWLHLIASLLAAVPRSRWLPTPVMHMLKHTWAWSK